MCTFKTVPGKKWCVKGMEVCLRLCCCVFAYTHTRWVLGVVWGWGVSVICDVKYWIGFISFKCDTFKIYFWQYILHPSRYKRASQTDTDIDKWRVVSVARNITLNFIEQQPRWYRVVTVCESARPFPSPPLPHQFYDLIFLSVQRIHIWILPSFFRFGCCFVIVFYETL